MSKAKISIYLVTTIAFCVLGTSATWAQYNYNRKGGFVKPCSLVGVNPAYHPDIFGNPAAARAYGFVLGRDRRWHVEQNCHTLSPQY
jgi:hypothetical protein